MLQDAKTQQLRTYLYDAVNSQLAEDGKPAQQLEDPHRLAELGIDSMGILRLYLALQDFGDVDLTRIADEAPPESIGDLIALGRKALEE